MACTTHPKYQAKRAPTADCEPCRKMWQRRMENTPKTRRISIRTVAEYEKLNEAWNLKARNIEKFSMKQTKLLKKNDIKKFIAGASLHAPVRPVKVEISFVIPQEEMDRMHRRYQKFMKHQIVEK